MTALNFRDIFKRRMTQKRTCPICLGYAESILLLGGIPMKLSFNEGTTWESASLQQNLEYCEKYGYDFIEIRSIDQLKDYLKEYTLDDLKAYFDTHHIKPLSLNA